MRVLNRRTMMRESRVVVPKSGIRVLQKIETGVCPRGSDVDEPCYFWFSTFGGGCRYRGSRALSGLEPGLEPEASKSEL